MADSSQSSSSCVVCKHKKLAAVDAALQAGEDVIKIAQRFGITKVALRRHDAHRTKETPSCSDSPAATGAPSPGQEKASNVVFLPRLSPGPSTCPICVHAKRAAIEASVAAGDTWKTIGRHHLVDAGAVRLHAEGCLKGALRRTGGSEDDLKAVANARARCLSLVEKVELLVREAVEDEEASWRDRAALIVAAKGALELLGRFTGEIGPASELIIVDSPKWKRIEAAISKALAPFPDAAAAVAKALADLEAA
ncbi:hypothetical protein [Sorangium sp. So ce542]|uniref:hypothetical protein n=1 Tax=Sorangium sp. So ce542 TaxID=3133316 RepID=UPI003F61D155